MARRDPFESFSASKAKKLPFPFVLEELAPLDPVTRPMFGALGVYVGDRIVMILRDKGPGDADSGVWLAFDPEHEASVESALPRLCTIEIFRNKVAGWKKLSSRSAEFEDDVGVVCRLLLEGDERIGKVPGKKRAPAAKAKPAPVAKKEPAAAKTKRARVTRTEPAAAKAKPARAVEKGPAAAKAKPARAAKQEAPRAAAKGRPSVAKSRPAPASKKAAGRKTLRRGAVGAPGGARAGSAAAQPREFGAPPRAQACAGVAP